MHTTSQPYEWRKRMRKINNNKKGWLHHKSQPVSIDTLKLAPSCLGVYWSKKKNLLRILALTGKYKRTFWAETWWCSEFFQSTFFFFFLWAQNVERKFGLIFFNMLSEFCSRVFFFFWRFLFFKPLDLALLLHRLKNFLNNYHGR